MPRAALPVAGTVALGVLLAACATSDHLYLLRREVTCSPFTGPVPFLAAPPDRQYVEVARIEASGAVFVPTKWETLRFYLCLEALSVEADAVFGLEQDHIGYSIGFTPLKVDWTNKKLTGVAIRYLEPGEQPEDVEAPPVDEGGALVEDLEESAAP